MTYDFFNTSNLAFGNKLTKAFLNLTKTTDDVYIKCQEIFDRWDAYQGYLNRNYAVPRPQEADNPVRSNEIYDLLRTEPFHIETMKYADGKLQIVIHKFNANTNRISKLTLNTTAKSGYVFYRESTSNQSGIGKLQRVASMADGVGIFLFQYRIDSDNIVNIIDDASDLKLIPFDSAQYSTLTLETLISNPLKRNFIEYGDDEVWTAGDGEWGVDGNTLYTYKVPEDMCLLAVGSNNFLRVYRGNTVIFKYENAYQQIRPFIIYAKKGETYNFRYLVKLFKVKYNQTSAS